MIQRSKERIKRTGEIFTPPELVEKMLDEFPADAWTTPDKKWLEPACGDGNFLIAILNRLMVGLEAAIPDPTERHKHIIEKMLYGVDIMQDNVDATIKRLDAEHLRHHIVCADALSYDYKFTRHDTDGPAVEPDIDSMFEWPS